MRRFMSGLILAAGLILCIPDIAPAQTRQQKQAAAAQVDDGDDPRAIYLLMVIAGLVATVVLYQFTKEMRASIPVRRRRRVPADYDDDDD